MKDPPLILVADDHAENVDILRTRLEASGYQILTAADGEAALSIARTYQPDLILLDIMMPKMDGIEVCKRLKGDPDQPFVPIILITAKSDPKDVVVGLDAGAEEYLHKPVDQTALVSRVRSMLRIKDLHDKTQEQAAQLVDWNVKLEERVAAQVAEIERVSQLKRFFSPQLADLIVSAGQEQMMESHRREITAVFCDLRGFTAFSEATAPDEVMRVLGEYHDAMGPLIFRFEATLEHFTGDGMVAFFNDPLPCPDPAARAVRMAFAMQQAVHDLAGVWRARGHDLGLGVGIAMGDATLGQIGFEGRFHYGAIGTVLNLASRLCDHARRGQILITPEVAGEVDGLAATRPIGDLAFRGFAKPMPVLEVTGLAAA